MGHLQILSLIIFVAVASCAGTSPNRAPQERPTAQTDVMNAPRADVEEKEVETVAPASDLGSARGESKVESTKPLRLPRLKIAEHPAPTVWLRANKADGREILWHLTSPQSVDQNRKGKEVTGIAEGSKDSLIAFLTTNIGVDAGFSPFTGSGRGKSIDMRRFNTLPAFVLPELNDASNKNLIIRITPTARVDIAVTNAPAEAVFDAVVSAAGLAKTILGNTIFVTDIRVPVRPMKLRGRSLDISAYGPTTGALLHLIALAGGPELRTDDCELRAMIRPLKHIRASHMPDVLRVATEATIEPGKNNCSSVPRKLSEADLATRGWRTIGAAKGSRAYVLYVKNNTYGFRIKKPKKIARKKSRAVEAAIASMPTVIVDGRRSKVSALLQIGDEPAVVVGLDGLAGKRVGDKVVVTDADGLVEEFVVETKQ